MRSCLLCIFALGAPAVVCAAQTGGVGTASAVTRLTVEAVNRIQGGTPLDSAVWSPDGRFMTFMAPPAPSGLAVGKEGDILQLEAETGKITVLATAVQLNALGANAITEQDRDHRDRYNMAAYLWSNDSKHLLLDKGGKLWLWDIQAATGALVVDTKAGSGDDPKFSPDGKSVSYLRGHNLYVYPVAGDGAEVALTTTPGGADSDALLNGEVDWLYLEELDVRTNYAWSPDSKAIAYLQMDEAKVPQYPIEDFIPNHATVNWQRYPQAGDPNPGVRVGVVPASGGETTWVNVPMNMGNDYIPRFGWVNAETVYVQVLARDHTHLRLYLADARTGASRLIHTESDAKFLEDNYDVHFLPQGRFLNRSWRDGYMHVYLYGFDEEHPLATEAKLVRQLTRGEFDVQSLAAPGVNGVAERIFFASTEGSPLERHLWTMQLDGTGKRELSAAAGIHTTKISPDGAYFGDSFSTLSTRAVARMCKSDGQDSCTGFWQSQPALDASGTRTRIVTLKAADGKTVIYGELTEPDGDSGRHSIPVILNPYGGPSSEAGVGNSWDGRLDQLFAQHGFAVLDIDNRGSGGRGRDFEQAAYRNFGAVQLADQLAGLDQVLAGDARLDPARVGWWGWSWGGVFTLYAMTHTDRIKAGVAVAPGSTDLRNYDTVYVERYMGLPSENADAYKAANVNDVAAKLKGRVMIAHGTGDDNVHLVNTMQFVQGLITAGIPYDLQLFPRLTHSIAGLHARDELFNRILYQFETYLKPLQPQP